MFQYAFGKNLANRNQCALKLDISFFAGQQKRWYGLGHFSIKENFATSEECAKIMAIHYSRWGHLKRKYLGSQPHLVEEQQLSFDSPKLTIRDQSYLVGYWQSESYFKDISAVIRREFEIKAPPSIPNQNMLSQINASNAVSIHIRRGDYADMGEVNKIHGTCSIKYYENAIKIIESKVKTPYFYVFSDDIQWAMKQLNLGHPTIFADMNNDQFAFEDIRLMQHCKHHIIANSTFSWWGAWLNPNPDKIVVAPKVWFADPVLNLQSSSIIPETWIRI